MATQRFDILDYLKTERDISGFLGAAAIESAEAGDADFIPYALGLAARARGMINVARETQLSREHLYRCLTKRGNPAYKTVDKIARTMGYRLALVPG
jgi:probable addiction module antidote protein